MTFDEWWNEIEYYGLRSERAIEDICHGCSIKVLMSWLEEAYWQGYNHQKESSGEGSSDVSPM